MHIVVILILAVVGLLELGKQWEDDHIPVWEPPCRSYTLDGDCSYLNPADDPVDEPTYEYIDEDIEDLP